MGQVCHGYSATTTPDNHDIKPLWSASYPLQSKSPCPPRSTASAPEV